MEAKESEKDGRHIEANAKVTTMVDCKRLEVLFKWFHVKCCIFQAALYIFVGVIVDDGFCQGFLFGHYTMTIQI